ncbi:MAG: Stage II sporulation protein E (SpoIIE), partial [uncultured bacterium]
MVIYFASVVKDGTGNRSGVVVARLAIEKLNEILNSVSGTFKAEDLIEVDLVDKDGLLLFSSHAKDSILQEQPHDWEMIQAYAAEGDATTSFRAAELEHGRRIEKIFAVTMEPGFKDFKGNSWMLILHLPVETAFASVDRLQLRVAVILLIAGLLGIATIAVFSHRMTLPLKQLAGAAREIGRGNLEVKVEIGGNDEVGELVERFNKMVVDLKNTSDRVAATTAE